MKKYIILFLFTIVYLTNDKINYYLNKEINLFYISSLTMNSLHDLDYTVDSKDKLVVLDFYIDKDCLYILPINGQIKLPIGFFVNEINNNYIKISNLNNTYKIFGYDQMKLKLYQYNTPYKYIGTTNECFVIKGDNLEFIANNLSIEYVQV